jgi:hypothetical protein
MVPNSEESAVSAADSEATEYPANTDQDSTAPVEIHQSGAVTNPRAGATLPAVPDTQDVDKLLAERIRTDPDFADRWEKDRQRERRLPARIRFAHRLRELIKYHGLSQRDVAERTGFSAKQISRYVNADHSDDGRVPELHDLHQLADGLHVSAGYFIDIKPAEEKLIHTGELPELPDLEDDAA